MNRQPIALVTLLAVLLAAGLIAYRWQTPARQAAQFHARQNRGAEAIGYRLGRAVAEAFPQGGDVLVLLAGLPAQEPRSGLEAARLRGLRAGFGGAKLRAVVVSYAPATDAEAAVMNADWLETGIPLAKLNQWFAGHAGAVAVVAFTLVETGPRTPPLFLAGPPNVPEQEWLAWVRPGGLEAVVRRRSVDWTIVTPAATLAQVFEQCGELITPANAALAQHDR